MAGALVLGLVLFLGVSASALNWNQVPSGTAETLYDAAFANGIFVAVGQNGTILTSPGSSGGAWTAQSAGTTVVLNGVASTNGGGPPGSAEWVVVGHNGTILYSLAANASTWGPVPAGGLPPGLGSTLLEQVTFGGPAGGQLYVAVGWNGTILTSPDGLNWTQPSSGSAANLADVEYAGGQYVVAGWNGTILTSPNGSAWTAQPSGTGANLYDLAHGAGTWVAVGAQGTILYSANGVNWNAAASGTTLDLYDVIYDGCRFVASGAGGTILTSPDGINWMPDVTGTTAGLFGLASGNGMDVAVGTGGTVLVAKGCQPAGGGKCASLPAGAVAWWPLNETSGATAVADVAGGHTGTPSTLPGVPAAVGSLLGPKPVGGMVNGALLFDRDDYVQVPNSPALNFGTGSFTVDTWVYAPPLTASLYQAIASKVQYVTGGTGAIGYRLYIQNGTIHFELSDGSLVATVAAPGWYAYGTWEFVAGEVDRAAGAVNLYVNGVLAASAPLPPGFGSVSNGADLLLGQFTTAGSPPNPNPSDGWIALDEVEVFNVALGQAAVQAIYTAGPAGKCPPGAPDLAVTKVQQGPAVVGATVYYQVYVANVGTAPMPGPVTMTDSLPSGTVLLAAAGSGWTCSPFPPPPVPGPVAITCTHPGPVPAGGSLPPVTIVAKVTGKAIKPGSLTNCASVAGPVGPGGTPLDQNPANDKSCVTSPVSQPGAICGVKWHDLNGNGVRDPGEPGLAGWTIEVRDGNGNLVASATTGKGGTYCIKKLPPGTYTVSEVLQPGWIQTAPQPVPPGTHTVTVASGQTVTGVDFGNRLRKVFPWQPLPFVPVNPLPQPDLGISKYVYDVQVVTGVSSTYTPFWYSVITYGISVTNVGGAPTPVPFTVTDSIPAGFTLQAVWGNGWSCTPTALPAAGPVTLNCSFTGPALLTGQTADLWLTIQTPKNNGAIYQVTNCAAIAPNPWDANATNDQSCIQAWVQ